MVKLIVASHWFFLTSYSESDTFTRFKKVSGPTLMYGELDCVNKLYLLKLATMMGMGRVIQRTPHIAQSEATSLPPAVRGAMSP